MFSMESLGWTSLLLVIFATSISVEADIRLFEEAFLGYGKKYRADGIVHANVESCNFSMEQKAQVRMISAKLSKSTGQVTATAVNPSHYALLCEYARV